MKALQQIPRGYSGTGEVYVFERLASVKGKIPYIVIFGTSEAEVKQSGDYFNRGHATRFHICGVNFRFFYAAEDFVEDLWLGRILEDITFDAIIRRAGERDRVST